MDGRTSDRFWIHHISTFSKKRVHRSFGFVTHSTSPNKLLQCDVFQIIPYVYGERYVLVLQDDNYSNCGFMFVPILQQALGKVIIACCATFGELQRFSLDSPTHSRNETLRLICRGLGVLHHLTHLYFSWSSGTVERLRENVFWKSSRHIAWGSTKLERIVGPSFDPTMWIES